MANGLMVLALLVELHSADGSLIRINPENVVSLRGPRPLDKGGHLFSDNARCLIKTTDGGFQTTQETCEDVTRIIDQAGHCGHCKQDKPP